jgi:hypothetical protein
MKLAIDEADDIVNEQGEVIISKHHGYDSMDRDVIEAMVEAYTKEAK